MAAPTIPAAPTPAKLAEAAFEVLVEDGEVELPELK
jgi:hypothetical protein